MRHEGVLEIGHLVVSLFCRCITFCKECKLCSRWHWLRYRIPFTLTFHPHNHAVKSIILTNFKLLQNDPDTGRIFPQPPLISFKRDKNIGNFLVRSVFQTSEQPGTFECARERCKTCSFICNVEKISGPKRSIKITDHFTCTSANVIYCITCIVCVNITWSVFFKFNYMSSFVFGLMFF